jgi:predicted phosphodiesterase
VVLGDVHANGRAFAAAVRHALATPFDRLVVLGDLLTYGFDIDEVIDTVAELQAKHGAALIMGNHDRLYLDLHDGKREYYDSLPDWLRESIDATAERLDVAKFANGLVWCEEFVDDVVYFAHANPFEFGDWRYLNSDVDHRQAAERLEQRGHPIGVFGHTHRRKIFVRQRDGSTAWAADPFECSESALSTSNIVVNPGSIGQPRDRERRSSLLRIDRGSDGVRLAFDSIDYDVEGHLASIRSSRLSERTKARLCSFFVQDGEG